MEVNLLIPQTYCLLQKGKIKDLPCLFYNVFPLKVHPRRITSFLLKDVPYLSFCSDI